MADAVALRVLVIEDDPDTRANLCDVLALDGHEGVPAGTAREALARSDWESYSAILLDWKLPDASSPETILPELRRLAPKAEVIVSTGVGGLEGAVAAIRHGASDYITKPIDVELLRASLRRIVHNRRLMAEKTRSDSAFRHLVEAASSLIVILHRDGRILYMNPAAEAITGCALNDVRGSDCVDLWIPLERRAAWRDRITDSLAGKGPVEAEESLVTRNGELRWILWSVRPFDDFDETPSLLAIGTDVTTRRRAEERLVQAERLAAIGKAMTGLAHESRNALQRCQANLELLALLVEDQPELRDIGCRLQDTQVDLYRLYEEVRQYAAPISLRREPLILQDVLLETWNLLAARQGRDAELRLDPSAKQVTCRMDRFYLEQALRNILENSLAAATDPVQVEATLAESSLDGRPAVELILHDNGPGIPKTQCARIFDEFFTTKQRGTGLGLAIVRRIVEGHGGQVLANPDSQAGAEIRLVLPLSEDTHSAR